MITIYSLKNNITGQTYVGQTSLELQKRLALHRSCAKADPSSHANARTKIAGAIREYGWENFSVGVHQVVSKDDADRAEAFWIEFLNALYPDGYNMQRGGIGSTQHTDESRRKIGLAHRGKTVRAETRAKIAHSTANRDRSAYTQEDINELRSAWKAGESGKTLAKRYGMSEQNVSQIVRNRLWFDPDYCPTR